MLIPLIQTTTTNLRTIPELVDKHFQDGELQEGFVLIQGCGNIDIQLKTEKIVCTRQTFQQTDNAGAYWYRAGMSFSYPFQLVSHS